ncbi:MAG: YihY/virulence factor BrkB family protein [Chloroflexi bacterium]|nr:YihY/virulence factor BrkB family protein [Chloroflexota bacterium]
MEYTAKVHTERLLPTFAGSLAKHLAMFSVRAGVAEVRRDDHKDSGRDVDAVSRPKDSRNGDGPPEHGFVPTAKAFMDKFGKDWSMNLCSMMAYNFLGAIFPLLLGILALGALVLPPSMIHSVGSSLNGAIPSAANGQNGLNLDFNTILDGFKKGSGLAAKVSFLALLWTGSNLFGVMENCFSIIFRTKDRDFVWQKLMSIAMILIFAILTPLSFVASSISGSYQQLTRGLGDVPGLGIVFSLGGFVIGAAFGFVLFLLIYIIVPNLKISWQHSWRGALVAGILFEAASLVFPFYATHFGSKSQFGAIAGLLAVLTMWFWVISLILIVGAQVNSFFALGQRAAADDLPGVMHGLKVHGEARKGEDVTSEGAQQRIMEDVQPSQEKEREGLA